MDFLMQSGMFQNTVLGAILIAMSGMIGYWIKGMPERARVSNESIKLKAQIEEDLRGEAALRFQEFRDEVHGLRNELAVSRAELRNELVTSLRRADQVNMLRFIVKLVIDELAAQDPNNKVLKQARSLMEHIEVHEQEQQQDTVLVVRAKEAEVDVKK